MESASQSPGFAFLPDATAGVFAVKSPTHLWIGVSQNLANSKRSLWFQLRNGVHGNFLLQDDWDRWGEERIVFEVLEVTPETERSELCRRHMHWLKSARALEL